jgi:hypothetical protein
MGGGSGAPGDREIGIDALIVSDMALLLTLGG